MEFSSNISLRRGDEERYQLLYATQLYGTLFGVFGKFEWEHVKGGLKINRMCLRGINYKGPYTLKIVDRFDEPFVQQSRKVEGQVLVLELFVKADTSNGVEFPEVVWDFERSYPGEDFVLRDNDYLRINRNLLPMVDATDGPIEQRAFKNGLFDEEFYYRDGLYVREKAENAHNMRFSKKNLIKKGATDNPYFNDLELDGKLGSPRCTPGMCKLTCP